MILQAADTRIGGSEEESGLAFATAMRKCSIRSSRLDYFPRTEGIPPVGYSRSAGSDRTRLHA